MLKSHLISGVYEAGCDEAGRGCLAGPVFAAAVILPPGFYNPVLNDSKKLSHDTRSELRVIIEKEALAWSVAWLDNEKIDELNILRASLLSMHMALDKLKVRPEHILVDGNRFYPYHSVPYRCIIRGDGLFASIAAASVLAKTWRDEFMVSLHSEYTHYGWDRNKGYPTAFHRQAIRKFGISPYHRKSFSLFGNQLELIF
jgi:ribonuclease HII